MSACLETPLPRACGSDFNHWYHARCSTVLVQARKRKNTFHMVDKALGQCVSLLKMIMNGGGGLFHGHPTDRKALLHNLGCFASFVKSIRLGRREHFPAISYTDEHMEPGLGSSVPETHYKLSRLCLKRPSCRLPKSQNNNFPTVQ